MNIKKLFLAVFLSFAVSLFLWSGDMEFRDLGTLIDHIDKPVRIHTAQGGSFQGILKSVEADRVELVDKDGQIVAVHIDSIEYYRIFTEEVDADTFFEDSASNRLIVMPTGFAMEPGELHVADQEIAAVTVSYGLNEHISFWAGISIPGFLVNARYIANFTPRFSVSFGSFAGLSWTEDLSVGAIIPYSIASLGEPNNNFTFGGGPLILFDREASETVRIEGAVFAFGGKKVITSSTSLISENWIFWGARPVIEPNMTPILIESPEWDNFEFENEEWGILPLNLFPALVFRIAGRRLSWDIGAVFPFSISNYDEVREGEGETETIKYEKTKYRIEGLGGVFVPIPIVSITYRID